MRFHATVLAVALCVWPLAAEAQIYAWRDANGTLVLSDRAIDAPTDVYAVGSSRAYMATRPTSTDEGAREGEGRYDDLIRVHAERHHLRPELVRAVIQVESGFDPRALSPKGAMGLMQLMPETAEELGVDNPWDPAQNIRGGTSYLRQLIDRYDGDEVLALAAYNAGAGAVARHGGRVPPYRETQNYVRKVRTAAGARPNSPRPGLVIYKTVEIIDGRAVPRYSSQRPALATYEIVSR